MEARSAHIYIAINTLLSCKYVSIFLHFMSRQKKKKQKTILFVLYFTFFRSCSVFFIFFWLVEPIFFLSIFQKGSCHFHCICSNWTELWSKNKYSYERSSNLDSVGLQSSHDSLFDFVHRILGFVSCNLHICIFPRPQTAHSANICKYVRVRVRELMCAHYSRRPMCACFVWHVNMNGWYLMFLNQLKCKRKNGMQNATSCTKLSNVSHIKWMKGKKTYCDFFVVIVVFSLFFFSLLLLKLNSHMKKNRWN